MTRVLLFTSQDVGNDVLSYLHDRSDVELCVVTQRTTRDRLYGYRSTGELCIEKNVPVLTPKTFDEAFYRDVERFAPDIMVCAYYPRIFPPRLIAMAPRGCINVHPGELPKYRGTFPTPWCILNNESEFGVTVHYMDARIDTGDILVQRKYPIFDDETGHALYRRAMKLCGEVLIDSFERILNGEIEARPQGPGGSYYNRIDAQYRIDWHEPRRHIRNQVRVHAKPYFPAYSFMFNKCVLINKVSLFESDDYQAQGAGIIDRVFEDKRFAVSCVDGCLLVEEYELVPKIASDDVDTHIVKGHRFR